MTEALPPRSLRRLDEFMTDPVPKVDPQGMMLGKYRLLFEIARGAMGVVYEAEDSELHRTVAVKLLQELPGSSQVLQQRFQREALAAAQLSHPHVVRVYDAGEHEGRMYLVM